MIDKSTRKQLAERKERVRRRINTKVDPENYEFIPAKKPIDYYDNDIRQRVAVYARVSTDNVQQTSSYELQKKYYEDFVVHHPNWTLVKIYADEGISGTSLAHRDEFNSMIADCRSGKIDMIITKSVSRFARNVVDCISMVRMLAELSMEAVAVTRVFHRCISSGTNSSVISAPQWMQVMPNRGGDLRVAGLTSPSMDSLPQKGQGFKMCSLISSTFLSSVDIELVLSPAALRHMDARLMLDLPTLALHIESEEWRTRDIIVAHHIDLLDAGILLSRVKYQLHLIDFITPLPVPAISIRNHQRVVIVLIDFTAHPAGAHERMTADMT